MTTALDIVTSALQNLGAIAIDEAPTAAESKQAISALNAMLETWSTESLTVYTTQPETFSLQAGIASYTMGVGGVFNTTRPIRIEQVKIRDPNGSDFPTNKLTDAEYAAITVKTVQSTLPYSFYDDGNFPLKTLFFYPVPSNGSYSAVIWSWAALSSFPSLATSFSFPPGYQEAMEFNLPIRLGPKYGRAISTDLRDLATTSKAQIMRNNTATEEMLIDSRLCNRAGYSFADFLVGK